MQTAVTAPLTAWADRVDYLILGNNIRIPPHFLPLHLLVIDLRQVWRGLNAPTFPFNLAGNKAFHIFGFSTPELLYLGAVAGLWYLVGRKWEQGKMPFADRPNVGLRRNRATGVALLSWGIFILIFSMFDMSSKVAWGWTALTPVTLITELLFIIWSLVLVWFGIRRVSTFSRTPQHTILS